MTKKENVIADEKLGKVTGGGLELGPRPPRLEDELIPFGMEEKTCPKCGTKYIGGHDCTGIGPAYDDETRR